MPPNTNKMQTYIDSYFLVRNCLHVCGGLVTTCLVCYEHRPLSVQSTSLHVQSTSPLGYCRVYNVHPSRGGNIKLVHVRVRRRGIFLHISLHLLYILHRFGYHGCVLVQFIYDEAQHLIRVAYCFSLCFHIIMTFFNNNCKLFIILCVYC